MSSIAEIKAAAAAKTAALLAQSPGNAAANLAAEIRASAPVVASNEPTKSRRYFSKIAGSRFIFSDGVEVYFLFGRLDVGPENTNYPTMEVMWKAYQKELNAILGKNPMIFVAEVDKTEKLPEVEQNALTAQELQAREANLAGLPQRASGAKDANLGNGLPTDVNQSTVDPRLRAEMFGNTGTITTEGAKEQADKLNAGAASQ